MIIVQYNFRQGKPWDGVEFQNTLALLVPKIGTDRYIRYVKGLKNQTVADSWFNSTYGWGSAHLTNFKLELIK